MKNLTLVFLFNALLANIVIAQPLSLETSAQIQTTLNDYLVGKGADEHITGIAASIFMPDMKGSEEGQITSYFAGDRGYAPFDKKITKDTLFEIGSITKSFIAALILQLDAQGKLSLDDPLEKWLPQYPQWGAVTIKELLNMTSGIPSYTDSDVFYEAYLKNPQMTWSSEDLLNYAQEVKPKASATNRYNYSNSNYILAGLIIEKVSNQSLTQQLKANIITPNHLQNIFYPAGENGERLHAQLQPRMAHGYFLDDNQEFVDITANSLSWAGAAGAIIADTVDVINWVQLLYHGKLFEPSSRRQALAKLQSVVSMKNGKPIATVSHEEPTAFGLGVGYYFDEELQDRFWVYEGGTLGFRVMYIWSACNNITTVVALNSKSGNANPSHSQGDGISALNLSLYKIILKENPQYHCKSPPIHKILHKE